jgi:hypothetical protein
MIRRQGLEYPSSMRALLAAIVAALILAPVASAEFGPPLASVPSTLRTIPVVVLKNAEDRSPSSCSVHARRSPGAVGKVERKLAPVACEQPPRPKLLDTAFGFFFGHSH